MTHRTLLVIVGALAASGCLRSERSCESATDCFAGEVCVQNLCLDEEPQPDVDAGARLDVGEPDQGVASDQGTGEEDAGVEADTGASDVGTADAGAPDAGAPDMGELPTGTYIDLFAGNAYSCALTQTNEASCWGYDIDGRMTPPDTTFSSLSIGATHACGVRGTGVVCWGDIQNSFQVSNSDLDDADEVFAGYETTCITSEGSLFCRGTNKTVPDALRRTLPSSLSIGISHICMVVEADGRLECWGGANDGRTNPPRTGPWRQVVVGTNYSCALDTAGDITCWGVNAPAILNDVPEGTFEQLASGTSHVCALDAQGKAVCWGDATDGKTSPPRDARFEKLAAGTRHTCGLDLSGEVECWGSNQDGRSEPP